ncbi:hypothetical protein VE03_06317 [Pseudogymnoascus sp. 23342-1-I1]|nr:hypothetical protein VE03_06317 [Pseudogymnoascus sp. 23342-1-I1]
MCNTDIEHTEVVRVPFKYKGKGKEEEQPKYPKVIGTSVIRLPKFTKGLGRVVQPVKPSADTKGKGKAVTPPEPSSATAKGKADEPSELPDAEGKGRTYEPSEPPDSKGKGKADELLELLNSKGKGKAVTPPGQPDAAVKEKAVASSELPDAKGKSEEVKLLCPLESNSKDKSVQTTVLPERKYIDKVVQTPNSKYKDKAVQTSESEYKDMQIRHQIVKAKTNHPKHWAYRIVKAKTGLLNHQSRQAEWTKKFERQIIKGKDKAVQTLDIKREDKLAGLLGLVNKKRKASEPLELLDNIEKGNTVQNPNDISKSTTTESGKGKAVFQPEPQDVKGKGKNLDEQESQEAAPAPGKQTSGQPRYDIPQKATRKRTRQDEEAFPRTFPRARPDNFIGIWREDLEHTGWFGVDLEAYKFIFLNSAYVHQFWVLIPGNETCEPLERYRCIWNACNRQFTRFFETVFKGEKSMEVGVPAMLHFIRLFDEFAETGILTIMIHAAMKVINQLMDPKQKSKFPISNIWDVGNEVEGDINHWFNINIIFQTRRIWYKRYFGMLSDQGMPLPHSLPGLGLPN